MTRWRWEKKLMNNLFSSLSCFLSLGSFALTSNLISSWHFDALFFLMKKFWSDFVFLSRSKFLLFSHSVIHQTWTMQWQFDEVAFIKDFFYSHNTLRRKWVMLRNLLRIKSWIGFIPQTFETVFDDTRIISYVVFMVNFSRDGEGNKRKKFNIIGNIRNIIFQS